MNERKSWRARLLAPCLCLLLAATPAPSPAQGGEGLVLSDLAPLQQLGAALLEGSGITVRNLPDPPRAMADLNAVYARQAEQYAADFRAADAVLTLGRLWPSEPLYRHARAANIRVVEIDASDPRSTVLSGIPVAESPVSGARALHPWLSPATLLQMLGIVARDLQALFPEQAAGIAANLARERSHYLQLMARAEAALVNVEDPALFALADEFVYLTRDLGLYVAGYLVKQDLDWTDADLAALDKALRDGGIRVVIHKWEPAAPIRAAVENAGATLVVLDPAETGSTGLREAVAGNIERLLEALGAEQASPEP